MRLNANCDDKWRKLTERIYGMGDAKDEQKENRNGKKKKRMNK
jgi:hypothetical protein